MAHLNSWAMESRHCFGKIATLGDLKGRFATYTYKQGVSLKPDTPSISRTLGESVQCG